MYVITGATGNIGSKIATLLLNAGKKIKVISRSADKVKALTAIGATQELGDLNDVGFLTKSFTGAEGVFAIIPPNYSAENVTRHQSAIADNFVQAIKSSGVKNVVALSSLGAHLQEKAGIVKGLHYFEERLKELKDINVLVLRPSYFMENLLGNIALIKTAGINGSPLKADLSFPVVATADIALKAFERLRDLNFSGFSVQYVLGPEDLTFREITQVLGKAIGKEELSYVEFPYDEAEKSMKNWGLSADTARAMVEFQKSMNEGLVIQQGIRNAENTTSTSLKEFTKTFIEAYNKN